MPELPDVELYLGALEPRIVGKTLKGIRLANPFVLRTVDPRPAELAGARVTGVRRVGKRIVIALEGDRFIVVHLMVAGRFRWSPAPREKIRGGAHLTIAEVKEIIPPKLRRQRRRKRSCLMRGIADR